jgi:hypothetical protein
MQGFNEVLKFKRSDKRRILAILKRDVQFMQLNSLTGYKILLQIEEAKIMWEGTVHDSDSFNQEKELMKSVSNYSKVNPPNIGLMNTQQTYNRDSISEDFGERLGEALLTQERTRRTKEKKSTIGKQSA